MSAFEDRCKDAHATFYITLVSIMESLALGYLLQALVGELTTSKTLSATMLFQSGVVLFSIILVWHQYAIGTIAYRWKLWIFDSIIPFLFGISQYLLIAAMAVPDKTLPSTPRFGLWLWAIVVFGIVGVLAYLNQWKRAEKTQDNSGLIATSKRSLCLTIGYLFMFLALAILFPKISWLQQYPWVVSLFFLVAFLFEVVRVDREYAKQ